MSAQQKIKLLIAGLDENVTQLILPLLGEHECRKLLTSDDLSAFLDDPDASQYQLAIAGSNIADVSTAEIAQSIRTVMLEAPILFCQGSRGAKFDRHDFIKNGFNDAFILPFDVGTFRDCVLDGVAKIRQTRTYKSVKVIDIQPNVALDFDVHILLPVNKKYIKYSAAGDPIDPERSERLKAHQVGSVFVPKDQMPSFYNYSAKVLKGLASPNGSGAMSETERKERLQTAVRDLVTDIFSVGAATSFEDGKQMMGDAVKIVEAFVTQTPIGDWYSRVLKTLGETSDSYSHPSSTAALAALFSMGLGIGKPEDFAVAGLFHDLGLSMVPEEIQIKNPTEWAPEEKKLYESHPELALTLMKERRISASNEVQTMIRQHHERYDGKGYPLGLLEPKLKKESQILGLADAFEYLTRVVPGQPRLLPHEAIRKITETGAFNPELTRKLAALFSCPETPGAKPEMEIAS